MAATQIPPSLPELTAALALFIAPDQITEIRCLPASGGDVVSGFFDGAHLADMAREAAWYSGKWAGVYFVPNPLRPSVLARRPNLAMANKPRGGLAKDTDVLARRYLLIDIDPVRAAGHEHDSTTDVELQRGQVVADACRAALRDEGWADPLVVCSGNGWHLYYRLSSNEDPNAPVTELLKELALHFDTPHAKIDSRVGNLARVMKVPGTLAAKGRATALRPHRYCSIVEIPKGWQHGNASESLNSGGVAGEIAEPTT